MSGWQEDWRLLVFVYIVCSSVWSILAKVAVSRLHASAPAFVAVTNSAAVVATLAFRELRWQSSSGIVAAAAGGLLGGIATLALYGALRHGLVGVVVPLSSLYLVLTVVLLYILLGEPVSTRQLVGIASGLAAIALLSK